MRDLVVCFEFVLEKTSYVIHAQRRPSFQFYLTRTPVDLSRGYDSVEKYMTKNRVPTKGVERTKEASPKSPTRRTGRCGNAMGRRYRSPDWVQPWEICSTVARILGGRRSLFIPWQLRIVMRRWIRDGAVWQKLFNNDESSTQIHRLI